VALRGNRNCGQGAIVTEHAYHGVTTKIAALSPEEWPVGYRRANVETIAPPGTEGPDMQAALDRLEVPLAATFLDSALTSDGIRFPPPDEVAAIVRRPTPPEASSSPTRCRRATAARATTSGRSSATGSRPTSSRSASRWATATQSRP